jgi:16S rRNA (cytidine1402-2'-O)-methyltransferase
MPATLFVVATPIGNLEDLSFRALRTLKEVDLIAAEDTRRTAKLLAHYAIRKSMVSLREHNERRETPRLIARLQAGQSLALVSDAGTPGISDPGQHLVRAALDAGIRVSPIPGPSAIMAALSASGLPADQFVFLGFPPRSGTGRDIWFNNLSKLSITAVFFEAPHRITRTLSDVSNKLVNQPIVIHREISKINEELVIRTNATSQDPINELGEFVVVVGQNIEKQDNIEDISVKINTAVKMFYCMTNNESFVDNEAEKLVSLATALDPRVIRKAIKKARIAAKRGQQTLS